MARKAEQESKKATIMVLICSDWDSDARPIILTPEDVSFEVCENCRIVEMVEK